MSMDLDALEALRSDAVAKRAEAARLFDVSYDRYGEYRKTTERKARAAADAAYGTSVDAFVVADKAARGAENALREAANDALPAIITRLRAAEARTTWHPIETAPLPEEGALGPWVQVWGVRFGGSAPAVHLARRDALGWGDRDGNSIEPLLWAPAMEPPGESPSLIVAGHIAERERVAKDIVFGSEARKRGGA